MSVKIIIDSASEWTKAEAEEKDLMFLPLSTTIDGTIYQDGVNIDHDTFYEMLKTCQKTPTTSQLRPIDFENAFRKASEEYDEILVITMSAKLSGTYQSAAFAGNGQQNHLLYASRNCKKIQCHFTHQRSLSTIVVGRRKRFKQLDRK